MICYKTLCRLGVTCPIKLMLGGMLMAVVNNQTAKFDLLHFTVLKYETYLMTTEEAEPNCSTVCDLLARETSRQNSRPYGVINLTIPLDYQTKNL